MKTFYAALRLTGIATIVLCLCFPRQADAQPGAPCPFDVHLSSQADVNTFPSAYGCTQIAGVLRIEGSDIANLDSLRILTAVTGLIIQNNPSLPNIGGLSGLTSVGTGGVLISNNAILTSLEGFANITTVGGTFQITDNHSLPNLAGLNALTSVADILWIIGNDSLATLEGLSSLTTINGTGRLIVSGNGSLPNLHGLETLSRILSIELVGNSSLTSVNGLSSVRSLVSMDIVQNDMLTNIDGFSSIREMRGTDTRININHNDVLHDVDGLSSITSFGDRGRTNLTISANLGLVSVAGISNISNIDGDLERVNINNNLALTDYCQLYKIVKWNAVEAGHCSWCTTFSFSSNGVNFKVQDILNDCVPENEKCKGNLLLANQSAIDAFPRSRGCRVFDGILTIATIAATNLDSLYILESAKGLEISYNGQLVSLGNGLANLSHLEYLVIQGNQKLTNLSGMPLLTTVNGDMQISYSNVLSDLSGLEQLTSVTGYLSIRNNQVLQNLEGLSSLTTVGKSLEINGNPKLAGLSGLNNLSTVGGLLIASNNKLSDLDALAGLDSIGKDIFNKSLAITYNRSLQWCCGMFNILHDNPPTGTVTITGNAEGCTQQQIMDNGPCCPTGSEMPLDKIATAEMNWGLAPFATNVIVQDYQPGIFYTLRDDSTSLTIAGPQSGDIGLFTGDINYDRLYNVVARDSQTNCATELSTKLLIHGFIYDGPVCSSVPGDKTIVAEQESGPSGMATNILVLNGDPGVVYALRNDNAGEEWIDGAYPASAGLYTDPLYQTTTFNVLAIDEDTHCYIEMVNHVTITINNSSGGRIAADGQQQSDPGERGHQFNISPNPGNGEFDLAIEGAGGDQYEVMIHDMTGKNIMKQNIANQERLSTTRIVLNGVPAGIYILSIRGDNGVMTTKKLMVR